MHIWAGERVKAAVVQLLNPVATEQLVVEVDADFGDVKVTSNDECTQEILTAIRTRFRNGDLKGGVAQHNSFITNLRAGNNDGFPEVLHHKGECARGVRQSVGAMQNDEAVVCLIRLPNVLRNPNPVVERHVATVQQRFVLHNLQDGQ